MRLLVYMKDGRTVWRIVGRGKLSEILRNDATGDQKSFPVEKGIWNPVTGEYVWRGVRLRHIAGNSIAYVEEDDYSAAAAA